MTRSEVEARKDDWILDQVQEDKERKRVTGARFRENASDVIRARDDQSIARRRRMDSGSSPE